MSLYNALFGYSPACIFALPILGHREDWFPRFRNAWMDKSADGTREIGIYTRVGSLNHGCGFGEEKLYSEPGFLRFQDDDFDATYGTYVFKCPEKWEKDFDALLSGNGKDVSDDFCSLLKEFWPKIGKKVVSCLKGKAAARGGVE